MLDYHFKMFKKMPKPDDIPHLISPVCPPAKPGTEKNPAGGCKQGGGSKFNYVCASCTFNSSPKMIYSRCHLMKSVGVVLYSRNQHIATQL